MSAADWRRVRAERRALYGSTAWRQLRAEKLAATGWRCERCGAHADEVHHKVKVEAGGPLLPALDGLVSICRPCHFREHEASRRAPRARRRRAWRVLLDEARAETGY